VRLNGTMFRPAPYLRRLARLHPQLVAAARELTLGEWVRHTAKTELDSVLTNPLVSLHTFIETILPKNPYVQDSVHRLRRLRLQRWAELYEQVFTAYGAPLRADQGELGWLDMAERFSTVAGGSFVRAQTRPTDSDSGADGEMLGQIVIDMLPALLWIEADDINGRRLQDPAASPRVTSARSVARSPPCTGSEHNRGPGAFARLADRPDPPWRHGSAWPYQDRSCPLIDRFPNKIKNVSLSTVLYTGDPRTGAGLPVCDRASHPSALMRWIPTIRSMEPASLNPVVGAELFEDVGDVWGEDGLGDIVRIGDLFAGVAELGRAVLVSASLSMRVATVLRKVCGVTQVRSVSARAWRHWRRTLFGDSQVPRREAKIAS
jgi:hypothetical protein